MIDPKTPVLIGAGQYTHRGDPMTCPSPIGLLEIAARAAAQDAGLPEGGLAGIDALGVVAFTIDAGGPSSRLPVPRSANPPNALARALGADPAFRTYTHPGGNTPQSLVNAFAERIAAGESELALVVGAEFLGMLMKRVKAGALDLPDWDIPDEQAPLMHGDGRPGYTRHERRHGLEYPANVYPIFENAWRAHLGRSLEAHQTEMGALMAPFTEVAAKNPYAWFPRRKTPAELSTPGDGNRMVGFPYPKFLNAIIQVDQSAGVVMASYEKACALGVPKDRMVFLHGCSDTTELWHVTDRVNYHSSPAIRIGAREALAMAGKGADEMAFFDLYSCFPVAVELACAEIGLATDDARGLTLTGGLPYFGGPGNNYTMHGIVEAVARCRREPEAFGLVTANGWFLTKHAMGVYSAIPVEGPWVRADKAGPQAEIDAMEHPEVTEEPQGPATIEGYTVVHAREGYRMGIVIGRDAAGRRFVANTPEGDVPMMQALEAQEGVGRAGLVATRDGRSVFSLG
jgi:acetyl-CoA C-acetyltransferase